MGEGVEERGEMGERERTWEERCGFPLVRGAWSSGFLFREGRAAWGFG